MRLLLLLLLLGCLPSCVPQEEQRLPYRSVYLELDLTFEDNVLVGVYSHRIYTPANTATTERTGFGGILVFHGDDLGNGTNPYHAYDIACPYERQASVVVSVEENDIYAVCPACHSRYDLTNAYPISGPSTYRLQHYTVRTTTTGHLIVSN